MAKRGLVLFVGATGSGKSTSLAALIDHRNSNSAGHIITIEDPVEYIHRHKKSIVNQREVGVDTRSFQKALKNTLRQAPDVILLGTPTISELILRGEIDGIKEIMEKSANLGMQTFDLALFKLWQEGKISEEEALKNADSANNLRLRIKLHGQDGSSAKDRTGSGGPTGSGLSLQLEDDEEDPDQ